MALKPCSSSGEAPSSNFGRGCKPIELFPAHAHSGLLFQQLRAGRVHSAPNVYIADGGLLPNPGGANPALTIQALAYWVSAHILRNR